jgi:flagellar biosynthesis protein FliQ
LTPQLAIHVVSDALLAAFWICAPLLLICFALGIVVNVIQIATSLQDQVFSTVPRLVACLGGFLLLMPWMLNRAAGYALSVMRDLSKYAH